MKIKNMTMLIKKKYGLKRIEHSIEEEKSIDDKFLTW